MVASKDKCNKLENIDKIAGHPTVKGMVQIKDYILEKMK